MHKRGKGGSYLVLPTGGRVLVEGTDQKPSRLAANEASRPAKLKKGTKAITTDTQETSGGEGA